MSTFPGLATIIAKLGYILCFILSWLDQAESQITMARPTPAIVPVDNGGDPRVNYFWSDVFSSNKYQMHIYAKTKNNDERLFIFDPKGATLRTPTATDLETNDVKAFIGKPGTGKLLAIYKDQTYELFTFSQAAPGSLSVTKTAGGLTGVGSGYNTVAAAQTKNTNHVFLLVQNANVEVLKFDYTLTKFNQGLQRSGVLGPTNAAAILENFGSEWLIFTNAGTRRIVVEKIGLYKLLDLTAQPASVLYVRNSHAGTEVFFSETTPTIQVRKYSFGIGPFAVTAGSNTAALANAVDIGLLNVGVIPAAVILWDKGTFAQQGTPLAFVETNLVAGSAIGEELSALGNSFEFSVYKDSGGTKNAAFFSLLFDFCVSRDPVTRVCNTCPATYYRSSLLADNYCLTKPEFIGGFGADDTNWLMARCDSKGCQDCNANYMLCVDCHNGGGYVLFNNQCLIPSELPNGKGFKSPDAVNDCLTGCLLCNYNADLCTKCDINTGYYLDPITSLCVQKSSFPANFGANLITGEMVACSTGCQTCTDNAFYCTICSAGYFLTPNKVCLSNSQLPLGYRINPGSGLLETCADGCSQCPSATTTCTGCFVANNYVLSGSKCLLMSSLPDGTGANLGTGTANLIIIVISVL